MAPSAPMLAASRSTLSVRKSPLRGVCALGRNRLASRRGNRTRQGTRFLGVQPGLFSEKMKDTLPHSSPSREARLTSHRLHPDPLHHPSPHPSDVLVSGVALPARPRRRPVLGSRRCRPGPKGERPRGKGLTGTEDLTPIPQKPLSGHTSGPATAAASMDPQPAGAGPSL